MTNAAPARPARRDARRNREALLAAAREVFAEHGIDASLEQIAARAGVGIGTLYRHFPTRIDLIDALLGAVVDAHVEIAERALAIDDAWDGFAYYLERTCELQAANRSVNDIMSVRIPGAKHAERARGRVYDLVVRVLRRAQDCGQVRADLTAEDLAFLTWANTRIIEATGDAAPEAWRRHLGLLLDGFRAEGARDLPVPSLTPRQVYRAMISLGRACTAPRH